MEEAFYIFFTANSGKSPVKITAENFPAAVTKAIEQKVDLSSADFTGEHFHRFDFSNGKLNNADFSCSAFYECQFQNADLSGAEFTDTGFWECDFEKASFQNADLYQTAFVNCNMHGCDLSLAKNLSSAVFSPED